MAKVSVIIPVYNAEKYLEKCINSVINQTYDNIEILLINDGSNDKSPDIIKTFAEKYGDKVIALNKSNGGVASARNKGLSVAGGDYIMFLDADDFIDHDCVEKLLSSACETQADIIRYRMSYVFKDGTKQYVKPDFENNFYITKDDFPKKIYKKMITGMKFNTVCSLFLNKKVITGISFREDMKVAEDLLFSMEVFTRAESFLYLSDIFYYYNQTEGSLTGMGVGVIKKYRYNIIIMKEQLKYLKIWDMDKFKYRFLTISRILFITLLKIKRILIGKLS